MVISLDIKVVPVGNNANLIINGTSYTLSPETLTTPEDLNVILSDQSEYIRNAVIGMLYEASA